MLLNVLVLPSKVSLSYSPSPAYWSSLPSFSIFIFVSLQCTTPLPDKCILLELTTIPTPIPPLPMYDLLSFHPTHILTLTLTLTLTLPPRPHPSSSPLALSFSLLILTQKQGYLNNYHVVSSVTLPASTRLTAGQKVNIDYYGVIPAYNSQVKRVGGREGGELWEEEEEGARENISKQRLLNIGGVLIWTTGRLLPDTSRCHHVSDWLQWRSESGSEKSRIAIHNNDKEIII